MSKRRRPVNDQQLARRCYCWDLSMPHVHTVDDHQRKEAPKP